MGELHCTLAWGSAGSVTEREGRWREREREQYYYLPAPLICRSSSCSGRTLQGYLLQKNVNNMK